ncbi:hypothetical protein C0991_006701 [Blastosporella zonata]|nr:hypothetical protein C0991_006701 [Blastosporella zonata]
MSALRLPTPPFPPPRPQTIASLTAVALADFWGPVKEFKSCLRIAELLRKNARKYVDDLEQDYDAAFILYTRAATLVMEKLPEHRDYKILTEKQKGNLRAAMSLLSIVINDPRLYQQLLQCTGLDAQIIIDTCQELLELLDSRDLASNHRWQIVTAMQRLSGKTGTYPTRFFLRCPIYLVEEYAVSSGSYGDIYKATAYNHEGALCLKVLRANQWILEKMIRVSASPRLVHKKLYSGASYLILMFFRFMAYIVFALNFLLSPHSPDRILLCLDTAMGIEYLHERGVIHGDIKSANVLVDRSGRAYLADFGLSNVDDPLISHWTSQSSVASKGGSARWQAPELHQTESDDAIEASPVIHNTEMSDVFAWGCLCYEIFTGLLPFQNIRSPPTIILRILQGHVPSRPKAESSVWIKYSLNEAIWELMEKCWT